MKNTVRRLPKMKDASLEAQVLNIKTYNDFLGRLSRIAMSMFEWENLPDSVDGQFIEWCLFNYGMCALLYYEDYGGFIATQCATRGNLNIYWKPISLECFGIGNLNLIRDVYNGLADPKDKNQECVLVENMLNRVPTLPTLELYAMRLAEVQRSEDVNIKQQKFPLYIQTDSRQLLTVQNTYDQYSGNAPVIIADKAGVDPNDLKSVNTETPFVADKLQQYRLKIFNEALSFLGVNNLNEKKERQLTSEVEKNNEEVNLNLQAFLSFRQKAARQFNKKYGFTGDKEVKVKVRSDLYNLVKTEESIVSDYTSKAGADNE